MSCKGARLLVDATPAGSKKFYSPLMTIYKYNFFKDKYYIIVDVLAVADFFMFYNDTIQ